MIHLSSPDFARLVLLVTHKFPETENEVLKYHRDHGEPLMVLGIEGNLEVSTIKEACQNEQLEVFEVNVEGLRPLELGAVDFHGTL